MTYGEKKRARRVAEKKGAAQTDHQSAAAGGLSEELKQKLWGLAHRLEIMLQQMDAAFKLADWVTKDRLAVRSLALVRYGIGLYNGRDYRIGLAFRGCRAFHALHPSNMKRDIDRFENELARCLSGIDVIPEPLIATMHKAQQRAKNAGMPEKAEQVVTPSAEPAKKTGDRRAPTKKPTSAKKRAEQGGHALKAALLSTGVQKTVARSATAVA